MKYYFSLQLKIFNRQLQGHGIPIFFFVLIALLILGLCYHFVLKYTYASYALLLISISGFEGFQNKERVELLKTLFVERYNFIKVRLVENMLVLIPSMIVTAGAQVYWTIPILIAFYLFYSLQSRSLSYNSTKALPTPFAKYPFEMIQFFRIYIMLILLVVFLLTIGILYENQNLTIFGIALIPLFAIGHIEKVEPIQILWNETKTAKAFLFHKIKRITLQVFALITPFSFFLLALNNKDNLFIILAIVYLLSGLLITLILFMKYSIYPNRIGILEAITLAISGFAPILFLGLYPYYYKKAITNLKKHLC